MIRRATVADTARLATTGMRAFANDPLLRFMIPNDDEYFGGAGAALQRILIRTWTETGEVWTADDGVAFAAWCPPEHPRISDELAAEIGVLREAFSDQVGERVAVVRPSLQDHRPEEHHWYLNLLATHPDWHRQGYGAAVMADVCRRCDEEGVGQYLETATPSNVAYYRSRGFVIADEWTIGDGVHLTGMWRNPGTGR